jgi:hypothetical protein
MGPIAKDAVPALTAAAVEAVHQIDPAAALP